MSKKMMLLALAAVTAALFAMPAAASAVEDTVHFENVTNFSGTSGAGSLAAEGEPTITCASGAVSGALETGGTTGTISLQFFECHTTVFGFTAKCRTTGIEKDNTIKSTGSFHLITTEEGPKPAILVTTDTVTIVCAGISNTIVHGAVIGTITSPKCGEESTSLTVAFAASGTNQDHKLWTGVEYDLTATTGEGGSAKTAGLNSTGTVSSASKGKLVCT